jgi:hypothetical protein
MKVVGSRKNTSPLEYLRVATELYQSLERWNPYPRPRGQVFKFDSAEKVLLHQIPAADAAIVTFVSLSYRSPTFHDA